MLVYIGAIGAAAEQHIPDIYGRKAEPEKFGCIIDQTGPDRS